MKFLLAIIFIGFAITAAPGAVQAQQISDIERARILLEEINAARVRNGLPPYASNPLLTVAAQRHSQYMRSVGQVVHEEPDAPSAVERVAETGYPFIRVAETIYAGRTGPAAAVQWWLTADDLHRRMVLHADMREAGIGAATNAEGTTYYTMVISAQANVLPVFINNGAQGTPLPSVVLTLTNETLFTSAAGRIGLATQVMVSNSAEFAGAVPQPWTRYTSWTLNTSTGPGVKTVYVRYIDAAGQFADAQDTIFYDPRITLTPTPTITPTVFGTQSAPVPGILALTPSGTVTAPSAYTRTPTFTPTPPTDTPSPVASSTSTPTETLPAATAEVATAIPESPSTTLPPPSTTPAPTTEASASPLIITATPAPLLTTPLSPQTLRAGLAGLIVVGIIIIIIGIYFLMRGLHA